MILAQMMRVGLGLMAVMVVGAVEVEAQWARADDGWCEERWGGDDDRYCMALEAEFDAGDRIVVDGGANGGVDVEGWSRDVVAVRARVCWRMRAGTTVESRTMSSKSPEKIHP